MRKLQRKAGGTTETWPEFTKGNLRPSEWTEVFCFKPHKLRYKEVKMKNYLHNNPGIKNCVTGCLLLNPPAALLTTRYLMSKI